MQDLPTAEESRDPLPCPFIQPWADKGSEENEPIIHVYLGIMEMTRPKSKCASADEDTAQSRKKKDAAIKKIDDYGIVTVIYIDARRVL